MLVFRANVNASLLIIELCVHAYAAVGVESPPLFYLLHFSIWSCPGQLVSVRAPRRFHLMGLDRMRLCYVLPLAIIASFPTDRSSSRFAPRSGHSGRTGGSYTNHSAQSGHSSYRTHDSYSARNGSSSYNSSLSKPENRYQDRTTSQSSASQAPIPNLGEKRNYSQSSLSSTSSYHQLSKISKPSWGDSSAQSAYSQAVPQVSAAPQSVQINGWNNSSQSWGKNSLPTLLSATNQAPGNNQWSNSSAYVPAPLSSQMAPVAAKSIPDYSQMPPPTLQSAKVAPVYHTPLPPQPPSASSQPAKPAAYVPQPPKQSSSYVPQPPAPAGYAPYVSQAPPAYPQLPPQTWSQGSWPSQQYPGY